MTAAVLALSLMTASPAGAIDSLMSVRELDSAMMLADSDSLKAEVERAGGDDSAAAALFRSAFEDSPSPGLFAEMWASRAAADTAGRYSDGIHLRRELSDWGNALTWEPPHLLSLWETASVLDDSLLADSLQERLLDVFPASEEAYTILGWEFYDSLYPVWYDDSARAVVLREFISTRGAASDIWRSTAYRYLLSATLNTADSASWRDIHSEWKASCPMDPQVYLSGAALLMDRDSLYPEALDMAITGLDLLSEGWVPSGMPEEEWDLTGPSLERGLHLRKLQSMWMLGSYHDVLPLIDSVISSGEPDMDDFATEASLFWLRGMVCLQMGDTTSALASFATSTELGDVTDRYSGMSEREMESILFPERSPVGWARTYREYRGPVFVELTPFLGPDSLLRGSRVSWCDWNADGYQDLFAGGTLYQNMDGRDFIDVTSEAGLDGCSGNGGIWGDVNRDGRPDLVTTGNPVQLFLSSGAGLVECAGEYGIDSTGASVEGIALMDWNADGWLDLYLASYEQPGETGSGTPDAFYLGGEDGFQRAGDSLGMVPFIDRHLCGRGVSPCDFDMDGDMDIFVSNYRLQENFLWENRGGTATNSALRLGIAGTDVDGWWGHTIGSAWGDWDNDGDWDLFSANLAHPRYITFSDRSMLYRNDQGEFSDVRAASGIRFEETHSNPVWGDFNNDGLLDLYITSVYERRRSFLYLNEGDGTFTDVTWLSGTRVKNGWGAAAADYNMDGRLDLAVGTGEGPVLLSNVTPAGNWALVRISPPDSCNPSALGCTVVLDQDGYLLMRQVEGGSGTSCQNGSLLHFGLPGDSDFRVTLFVPGQMDPVAAEESLPGIVILLE